MCYTKYADEVINNHELYLRNNFIIQEQHV